MSTMSQLEDLKAKLLLDISDFVENGKTAEKHSSRLKDAVRDIGKVASSVLTDSAKSAVDFESAFSGVRKTVDAPPGDDNFFDDLQRSIIDLSGKIPATAGEIADVVTVAGQLGVASDSLLDFSETVIGLGTATNLTAEEAATMFAQFGNVTKLPQDAFDEMGSSVAALGNNLATTERDVMNFAMELGLAGSMAGMSQSDILGWSRAMASMGLEAASSGTAFQRFTSQITGAVAGTNSNLETFARVAGVSAEDFSRAWETDATGALEAFLEGLSELSSAERLGVFDELGIKQQDEITVLGSLASNMDLVRDSLSLSNEAWAENTALATEAAAANGTTANQVQMLKNGVEGMAIQIGTALLPVLQGLLDFISPLAQAIGNFVSEHPGITAGILGITAALGGVIAIAPGVSALVGIVGGVPVIIAGVAAAAAVAAAAVVAHWDEIKAKTAELAEAVREKFEELKAGVAEKLEGVRGKIEELKGNFSGFRDDLRGKIEDIKGFFEGLWQKVSGVFDNISQKAHSVMDWVQSLSFDNLWNAAKGAVGFRAEGGSVSAGSPYVVGERGPELFIPAGSGQIVSHEALREAFSGGNTIGALNVYVTSTGTDAGEIAEEIGAAIQRKMRYSGAW